MYRLCQQYGLLIVEDDPYCYLRYGAGPGACLRSGRVSHTVVGKLGMPVARVRLCSACLCSANPRTCGGVG